jgi:hypothetical protein
MEVPGYLLGVDVPTGGVDEPTNAPEGDASCQESAHSFH